MNGEHRPRGGQILRAQTLPSGRDRHGCDRPPAPIGTGKAARRARPGDPRSDGCAVQPTHHRKIVAPQRLAAVIAESRAGRRVVHCHGCFDIVHPGHLRYLQFARGLGEILVVSLTGDAGVSKGADRPYIPQELRAENLAALEFVDWVVVDPHPTACELLDLLRPDVYVKGREYAGSADTRFLAEREIVERNGGRVVFHSGDVVFSSTQLIRSLDRDDTLENERLATICRRGGIDAPAVHSALLGFRRLRAVIVGDTLRERYALCDTLGPGEDAPILCCHKLSESEHLGGAAALAQYVAALGAQTTLITSSAGGEADAGWTRRLTDAGVSVRLVRRPHAAILRTTYLADDSKLMRCDEGEFSPLDSSAERQAFDHAGDALRSADLLLWSDHGLGFVTPGLLRAVEPAARAAGVLVAGHAPGPRGQLVALRETTLLTATERQLRAALGDMASGLPTLAWAMLDRTAGRTLIVSMRRRGTVAFDGRGDAERGAAAPAAERRPQPRGYTVLPARPRSLPARLRSEFVPALSRGIVDWRGAEEALLAGGALALAGGQTLAMAAYLAGACEAICAGTAGGGACGADALAEWCEQRRELRAVSRFAPDAPVESTTGAEPAIVTS